MVEGDLQALEDVLAHLCAFEQKSCSLYDDGAAMFQEFLQDTPKGKSLRLAVYQSHHIDVKNTLKGGVLVEVVEDSVRAGVLLQVNDNAHSVTVGFISQGGYSLDSSLLD